MGKPNPRRQEIVDYVAREIAQHRAGKIDSFTTMGELAERYVVPKSRIHKYLIGSFISPNDRDYRSFYLRSQRNIGKNNPFYGKSHSEKTREKLSEALSGTNNANYGMVLSEETKKRISDAHKGKTKSKSHRKRLAEANKGKKLSAEVRKKMSKSRVGKKHSEETKMKISKANKGRMMSGNAIKKFSGENHPRWNGGSSFLPYSPEFVSVITKYIRERDNYACQFCDAEQNGKAHAVHHIDHDKTNDSETNLIALCGLCHNNETASRGDLREEWIEWCQLKVGEIYGAMTDERRSELQGLKATLEGRLEAA